jgi:hypothetical protein
MIALLPGLLALASAPSAQLRPPQWPPITANDNRRPAGMLLDRVVTARLAAHDGLF